jgi:chromosome segregation protein
MKVKRLEIQGFKSFKDKTVIHFDHSITGIVGPNGCGKSNIVDAFFWVMGEQSYKHMRGSGSEDLIFNGSTKYQPLGLAEATLVLETDVVDTANEPAGASFRNLPVHLRSKEVSVTRRVYRSGEGEYFINGQPARLKDIQELFMDTGVGAKGYSVIEQGQIGKIVNSKPEERRLLIEEAAGIAKYKARKKESLRKLEAAQANLARLNDVIQVIEKSLGSLERQAQKARQYKKYKEELLSKEMTWGRRKRKLLQTRLETLKADRERLEQELAALRAEISTAETTAETSRLTEQTDSKQAEELSAIVNRLQQELTREQSQLELSRSRQEDLARQETQLTAERSGLLPQIEEEESRIVGQEIEVAAARAALEAATEAADEVAERSSQARAMVQGLRSQHAQANQKLMSGFQEASQITAKDAAIDGRIESAMAQAERIRSESSDLVLQLEQAREQLEILRVQHEELLDRKQTLAQEKSDLARALQDSESGLKAQERAREDKMRALSKDRSRLQSLEELEQAYEGYAGGPKAALDWARQSGRGELKAVASLLHVESGFEGTLELWLESHLQDLVAPSEELAVDALRHLAESKKGRATLRVNRALPALSASFAEVRTALEAQGLQVLGELSQFVRAEETSLSHLIDRACVVESFGATVPRLADGWSLVSRDGLVLKADGELRGGAVTQGANAASLLGRKRLIEDLRVQVAQGEEALTATESAIEQAREALQAQRAGLSEAQARLQEVEIQAAGVDRDFRAAERSTHELERRVTRMQEDLLRTERDIQQANEEKAKLADRLQWILQERETLQEEVQTKEALLREEEETLASVESELQTLRVQEAQARERSNSISREFEAVRRLADSHKRRLAEIDARLEQITHERGDRLSGEPEVEARIVALHQEIAERREALALVKDRLQQTANIVSDFGSRLKELRTSADEKASASNRAVIEVERLQSELGFLIQNLEEKYGAGCLDATEVVPEQSEMAPVVSEEMTADEEQLLNEEVERLRERIRRLGEINVNAIEEFEAEQKNHENLFNQKRDLDTSIQNLQDAIQHINKTSEERFKRAFEAIATRFEKLFPIIFGGGQAKLSLVYPEGSTDILEAGVDILAQPPGKKVVNIGLLSGGEKALTAVSLIFAIFMVKPSPFCVLDEVDAPLDDANIGKFNALLKEMSSKSQFIIITHNKKTMELNETLYGVTMEEPGVSKMVSIEMH